MVEFVNRYKNIRFECEAIARPGSLQAVRDLVGRARAEGRRLKAVGGAHGFNNNIKTPHILVDLARMNRVLSIDSASGTAMLEAGITLADAIAALDAAGLHFPSLGSWSGQSIAGAIATSTHGSSLVHGTLSDIVVGVEAVLADGSVAWISEGDRLKAMRAHIGQLALITRVEIACAPAFMLACSTEITPVSRTIGRSQLVDEMIFRFTHTIEMDWMLPGIAPTGRRVEVPLVAIVGFRDGKVAHERIYWDQASVLVQLGLIDAGKLPVAGIESARKVLDPSQPSNALMQRRAS